MPPHFLAHARLRLCVTTELICRRREAKRAVQENRLGRTGKSFTPYRKIAYPLQGNFRIPRRFAAPSVMLAFPRVRVHARGMSYGDINNIPY